MAGGTLSLSLLSRGVGEVQKNGHERVDVYLEPEDYYNFFTSSDRFYLPPVHSNYSTFIDPSLHLIRRWSRDVQEFRVPKTFSTRKGALLLFSEDLAQRNGTKQQTIGNKCPHHVAALSTGSSLDSQFILKTVDDLATSILKYGATDQSDASIYLKFVHGQRNNIERQIRPGFSAKRYLWTWTRTWEDKVFDNIIEKGYITEKSLHHYNMVVPSLRRKLFYEDLSHMPQPYRLMRSMLLSPGSLSGYTFYRDLTLEQEEHDTGASTVSTKADKQNNIRVIKTSGSVQEEVAYSGLGRESQKEVITDLLVKSAVHYALMKQEEMYEESILQAVDDEETGGGTTLRTKPEFDMQEAVESLLESQSGSFAVGDKLGDVEDRSPSLDVGGSFKAGLIPSHLSKHNHASHKNRRAAENCVGGISETHCQHSTVPVLPPINHAPLPVQDVGKGTRQRYVPLPPIAAHGASTVVPKVLVQPATPGQSAAIGDLPVERGSQVHDSMSNEESGISDYEADESKSSCTLSMSTKSEGTKLACQTDSISDITEKDIVDTLTDHAQRIAESVLGHPSGGTDLESDVRMAAQLWMEQHPPRSSSRAHSVRELRAEVVAEILKKKRAASGDPSAAEYRNLIKKCLTPAEGADIGIDSLSTDAEISPELPPDQTEIINDGSGNIKIQSHTNLSQVMNRAQKDLPKDEEDVRMHHISIPGSNLEFDEGSYQETTMMMSEIEEKGKSQSSFKDDWFDGRTMENSVKMESMAFKNMAENLPKQENGFLKDVKKVTGQSVKSSRTTISQKSDASRGSMKKEAELPDEKGIEKEEPFVVGKPKEKKPQKELLPLKKEEKRKSKGRKGKKGKKKEEKEKPPQPPETPPAPAEVIRPEPTFHQPSPTPVSTDPKPSSPESETNNSDLEFHFVREQSSPLVEGTLPSVQILSPSQKEEKSHVETGENEGDLRSITNQEARAAKRAAAAARRRQEVERKRKEKEDQIRREKEEAERQITLQREMDEERKRREDERRLHKQQQKEAEVRDQMEEEEAEKRQRLEAEREKRAKEEFQRKLEEMKRKQQEEDMRKNELMLQRQKEEEERCAAEELMLSQMAEEERLEYERKKREEEEERKKKALEEKLQQEEEARKALAEAHRLAEEMAKKKVELEARFRFNRSLHEESSNLSQAHSINRAFVFSYFELLQWLGLDIPDFELAKLANY